MEALPPQTRRAPARHRNAKIQTFPLLQLFQTEEALEEGSLYTPNTWSPHYSHRNTAPAQLKATLERINGSIKRVIMNQRSSQDLLCVARLRCSTGGFTHPPPTAAEFRRFCLPNGRRRSWSQIWHASVPGGGGKAVQRGHLLSQVLVRDAKSAAIQAPSPLIIPQSGR